MNLETKAAFARRLNWNRSAVTRAAQAGRLVLVGNLVDVEPSLARLKATEGGRTDVAARHAAARSAQASPAAAARENAPTAAQAPRSAENDAAGMGSAAADTDGAGRARYKAITMQFENQQIKLGMAMARGLRFNRKDVAREAYAWGAVVAADIQRTIDQAAARLKVMSNTRRRELLIAEIGAIKRAVNRAPISALRRLRSIQQRGEA